MNPYKNQFKIQIHEKLRHQQILSLKFKRKKIKLKNSNKLIKI